MRKLDQSSLEWFPIWHPVASSEQDSIVLNLTLTNRDFEFQVRRELSLALVDGLLDLLEGGVFLMPFCPQ